MNGGGLTGTSEAEAQSAACAFFTRVLERAIGSPLPRMEIQDPAAGSGVASSWIGLLNLAVTPSMMREALKADGTPEEAGALLRYLAGCPGCHERDRDKADLLATFLFRRLTPQESRTSSEAMHRFEKQLDRLLAGLPLPPLPDAQIKRLQRFETFRHELEMLPDFDALTKSGLLSRVRDFKKTFGASSLHPRVLATVAVHNVLFGARFDALLLEAAERMKELADRLRTQAEEALGRISGESDLEEMAKASERLGRDCALAQSVLEKRELGTTAPTQPAASSSARPEMPPVPPSHPPISFPAAPAADAVGVSREFGVSSKIEKAEEDLLNDFVLSIRTHVRSVDSDLALRVPLHEGTVFLTSAEAQAFRAEYACEQSFRGELAAFLVRSTAVFWRMTMELEQFRRRKDSAYLWQPHFRSLQYLLGAARRAVEESVPVLASAEGRGLTEKVELIQTESARLQTLIADVESELSQAGKTAGSADESSREVVKAGVKFTEQSALSQGGKDITYRTY